MEDLKPIETPTDQKSNLSQQELTKKLKEDIKHYFVQLSSGCNRDICYNENCRKSKKITITDKNELVAYSMKLAKSSVYNKCLNLRQKLIQYDPNLSNIQIKEDVENLAMNFLTIELSTLQDIQELYLETYFNFDKLKCFFKDYEAKVPEPEIEELENINKFSTFLITEFKNNKLFYTQNFKKYIMYLYSRLLLYISLHPKFGYQESNPEPIKIFFQNFISLKKIMKESNINFLDFFKKLPKPIFQEIVSNYQNFLTVYFFSESRTDLIILIFFMKTFKILYQINEKNKYIHFKSFYNDAINRSLDIERDFSIYLSRMKKKIKVNEEEYCLLAYPWIFDAASKNEVLYYYNCLKQKKEVLNDLMNIGNHSPTKGFNLVFEIQRENMIEDTLNIVTKADINFKKPLKIKFKGEQGIDQGGVKKEFFLLLIRQLFDLNYGMFTYYEKSRLFWFNQFTFEAKMKYELIGIIMGLAMFNSVILDLKFPSVVYKKLLGLKPKLKDLKELDPEHYNTLKFLKHCEDNNLQENLGVTFSVVVENFGQKEIINLKENGENIYVNQQNKLEYIELYIDWFFNKSIDHIFNLFKKGFYMVCDSEILKIIRHEELEQIICGETELNFKELELSAKYEDGFTEESNTIKDLWEVIHKFNEEDKKKFLFFVTGCDRAPINGLKSLEITISKFGSDKSKLPCAHTCFNHLLLPDYDDKEKLQERLLIAINNAEGFGLM